MIVRIAKYLSLIILLGLGIVSFKWYEIYSVLHKPLVLDGHTPLIIEIKPNSTANSLVNNLSTQHLIQSSSPLLQYIKWKKWAGSLKAGIYKIEPGESSLDFLEKVVQGKVLSQSLTIIEGSTVFQVKKQLESAQFLNFHPQDFQVISKGFKTAEGLLLADTYHYDAGSEAQKLLQMANKNLMSYLNDCWENRSPGLPYQSPYELLVVASIIEKEASLNQERKIISGVIVNRLKKHMPLQMDPTVIYALGPDFSRKLTHQDLSIDSPYNTYLYRGLPPTPIAMVGKNSILAAAQPEFNAYLYYVAKGDGSHYFSTTYEEQKRAISRFLIKKEHNE